MTESLTAKSEETYFFDTYAIIELIKKNKNYEKFKAVEIITGMLNYGELFYWMLKNNAQDKDFLNALRRTVINLKLEDVCSAMEFRFKNRKKNFSFVDSVGYQMASRRGMIFVTGDQDFKGMRNVEHLK